MPRVIQRLVLVAVLIVIWTHAGCATRSVSKPRGEGYGLVSFSSTTDFIHWGSRHEIDYWDSRGKKTKIWHSLADRLVQQGDTALFEGYVYQNPHESGTVCLFAVHAAGPPSMIADNILDLWREQMTTNSNANISGGHVYGAEKADTNFLVHVGFWGKAAGGTLELTREQVLSMIRDAKQNGERLKDGRYQTAYIKGHPGAELRGKSKVGTRMPNDHLQATPR